MAVALLLMSSYVSVSAQGTIDLLNYSGCTVKFYDWDYGTTDGQNYGWVFTQHNGVNPDRQKIITTANSTGSDPHVPITDLPAGGSTAVRLGTMNYNTEYGMDESGNVYIAATEMAKGGGVVFSYQVTQENAILYMKYATMVTDALTDHYNEMVNMIGQWAWNDGVQDYYMGDAALFEYEGDWKYQQPYVHFYLGIDGQELDCTNRYQLLYDETGNPVNLSDAWKTTSFDIPADYVYYHYDAYYKPWSTLAVDLSPYIGHTVSLGAEYFDCAMAGWYFYADEYGNVYYDSPQIYTCDDHHLARLYLSASCGPAGDGEAVPSAITKVNEDCTTRQVVYAAPDGFSSYRWFTSTNPSATLSTTQSCTYTFSTDEEDTYLLCTVVSPLTTGCGTAEESTLQLHITNPCATPEIEKIDEHCSPDWVKYKAPAGFVSYRWFTSANPAATLSGTMTCTYEFSGMDDEVYLFCEMTAANGSTMTTEPMRLQNTCMASDLTMVSQDCNPARVTYEAPVGYAAYRWFAASNPGITLSSNRNCTYEFGGVGEETDLFCEVTTGSGTSATLGPQHIVNTCPASELTYVEGGCKPDWATYSAPAGYTTYRWFTQADPSKTLSTSSTCTYNFTYEGEAVDLYCEAGTSGGATTALRTYVVNPCTYYNTSKVNIPPYVCADAGSLVLTLNYEEGTPLTFDLTFDQAAVDSGFVNVTGGSIKPTNGGNPYLIEIPLPKKYPYVTPDRYNVSNITIHQSYDKDTTFRFGFYVYYPTWVLKTKWDNVVAVKNASNNGGYDFSAIRWYRNGEAIEGRGDMNSYIYLGDGNSFKAGDRYWAELTRSSDGKTFCTCPIVPVTSEEAEPLPERKEPIVISVNGKEGRNQLHLTAPAGGTYVMYNVLGQRIGGGVFEEGQSVVELPFAGQGTYLLMFRMDDGTRESRKVLLQ